MRSLRELHLYLGCVFAPMILYFALSGAWQAFRLNDIPKDAPPTLIRTIFHELSKPHTHSTAPGSDAKTQVSVAFEGLSLLLGLGLLTTTAVGIALAFKYNRSPKKVYACLAIGTGLPVLLLFLR